MQVMWVFAFRVQGFRVRVITLNPICMYMFIFIFICVYVYIHTHAHTHTRMLTPACESESVCEHACVCVCVCVYIYYKCVCASDSPAIPMRRTPGPCSVCGSPRLCRRRERCLIEARFDRWPLAWRKIWAVSMFDLAV